MTKSPDRKVPKWVRVGAGLTFSALGVSAITACGPSGGEQGSTPSASAPAAEKPGAGNLSQEQLNALKKYNIDPLELNAPEYIKKVLDLENPAAIKLVETATPDFLKSLRGKPDELTNLLTLRESDKRPGHEVKDESDWFGAANTVIMRAMNYKGAEGEIMRMPGEDARVKFYQDNYVTPLNRAIYGDGLDAAAKATNADMMFNFSSRAFVTAEHVGAEGVIDQAYVAAYKYTADPSVKANPDGSMKFDGTLNISDNYNVKYAHGGGTPVETAPVKMKVLVKFDVVNNGGKLQWTGSQGTIVESSHPGETIIGVK